MESMYQRSKIQEESLHYERRKHDGSLPIIGLNTYLSGADATREHRGAALSRSTDEEKRDQVRNVESFRHRHAARSPAALARLQTVAATGGNIFTELMQTVRCCSLGQITGALYEVGGRYRRNM
jgi:methylmalonyl-CoA mutase